MASIVPSERLRRELHDLVAGVVRRMIRSRRSAVSALG